MDTKYYFCGMDFKQKLISQGVLNLQEFGYCDCTPENILSDSIYSRFFLKMLEESLEDCKKESELTQIQELLIELKK